MDPVYPWLDAAEVARLAKRLLSPVSPPLPGDAGFGEEFEGYEPGRGNDAAATPTPPPIQADADVASTLTREAADGTAAGDDPMRERFGHFREWMRRHLSCSGLFLLDGDGDVISDDTGYPRLHTAARNLALAARRPGTDHAPVHMKIGSALIMAVVPVDTPYGQLVLGMLLPSPLEADALAAVTDAMRRVIQP